MVAFTSLAWSVCRLRLWLRTSCKNARLSSFSRKSSWTDFVVFGDVDVNQSCTNGTNSAWNRTGHRLLNPRASEASRMCSCRQMSG